MSRLYCLKYDEVDARDGHGRRHRGCRWLQDQMSSPLAAAADNDDDDAVHENVRERECLVSEDGESCWHFPEGNKATLQLQRSCLRDPRRYNEGCGAECESGCAQLPEIQTGREDRVRVHDDIQWVREYVDDGAGGDMKEVELIMEDQRPYIEP